MQHRPDMRQIARELDLGAGQTAAHAQRVLAIMGDFGVDTERYEDVHPWAARLPRDADIVATRQEGDMRLSVFHYPLQGWVDAVVMNVLQGLAAKVQLTELGQVSYQPLAEVFRAIAPVETRHAELGIEGLAQIAQTEAQHVIARHKPRFQLVPAVRRHLPITQIKQLRVQRPVVQHDLVGLSAQLPRYGFHVGWLQRRRS